MAQTPVIETKHVLREDIKLQTNEKLFTVLSPNVCVCTHVNSYTAVYGSHSWFVLYEFKKDSWVSIKTVRTKLQTTRFDLNTNTESVVLKRLYALYKSIINKQIKDNNLKIEYHKSELSRYQKENVNHNDSILDMDKFNPIKNVVPKE